MTVLGISIGTTRTGICILEDGILLDRNLHRYDNDKWSDTKLRIIIKRYREYIIKYNVTAIMVKVPPSIRHTPSVKSILRRIDRLVKEYRCDYDLITKGEIKQILLLHSTHEIVAYAKLLYPELAVSSEYVVASDKYFKKLYEAVLSAYIYQERQRAKLLQ